MACKRNTDKSYIPINNISEDYYKLIFLVIVVRAYKTNTYYLIRNMYYKVDTWLLVYNQLITNTQTVNCECYNASDSEDIKFRIFPYFFNSENAKHWRISLDKYAYILNAVWSVL